MNKYHVTYYYLATGMEGVADTDDLGIVEATSEEEALEKAVNIPGHRHYAKEPLTADTNLTYRYWGLSAKLFRSQPQRLARSFTLPALASSSGNTTRRCASHITHVFPLLSASWTDTLY